MDIRLKRTPGIYLVGFMGCGKTTVGRLLAERLGWQFVDVDDDIEARAHTTIARIFETCGEDEFRRIETEAIRRRVRDIECGSATVVALGGGAFCTEANLELIAGNGVSVWLDCPFEILKQRVEQETHRPLARDPQRFAALHQERLEVYSRADFRVMAGDDPAAVVEAVLALPFFR
ncbi:MAG TPA: shikimate kinase [Bryobacteraceae bacterium]|nr:shikimate kinase [Bryobacteraceae bacterium]